MVLAVMESANFDKAVREVFVEKVTFDKGLRRNMIMSREAT